MFVIFIYNSRSVAVYNLVLSWCTVVLVVVSSEVCDGMHDCVWMHAVFIVWNLLEDTAQLQPWPRSLAYCQEVKGVRVGLNLCSKTVSWADVLFAYSCTATYNRKNAQIPMADWPHPLLQLSIDLWNTITPHRFHIGQHAHIPMADWPHPLLQSSIDVWKTITPNRFHIQ